MSVRESLVLDDAHIDTGRARLRRFPALRLLALGMLLLQLSWVFAVPPFNGSDEFDHVYKAAAVARGEWFITPSDATRGTGAWLEVPVDIVKAARPACMPLPYTGVTDCVGWWHGDTARIASGAGRYHPLFYALVGIPALAFTGDAALYVMRLMTVLLAWGLFCLALTSTRAWARGPWPFVGVAAASTPVLVYSSSIVAPNGVEMMAALALWTSLIGLVSTMRHHTLLLVTASISGCLLATLRSLGPVWCLLIAGTVLLAAPPPRERLRLLLHQRGTWLAAGLVFLSAAQSTWWILSMKSLDVGGGEATPTRTLVKLTYTAGQAAVWILQSIAAFPLRDEQSQPVVYACYLVLFLTLLALGLWAGNANLRLALLATALISIALPFTLTVAEFASSAGVWQGRYGLPYAIGIVVLAGLAMDRRGLALDPRAAVAMMCLFVVGESVGPVDVLLRETANSPLSHTSAWLQPPSAVVALLAGIASAALWLGACRAGGKLSHVHD